MLLHGFTQTGRSWDTVRREATRYRATAPDLRGHGTAAARRPVALGLAKTSGVEREPGEVQASRRPQRASSSQNARRPR